MNLSKRQLKALRSLVSELTGGLNTPHLSIQSEKKYEPLRTLTDQQLSEALHYYGEIAPCDECDHWCELEMLNDSGVCSDCEGDEDDPELE